MPINDTDLLAAIDAGITGSAPPAADSSPDVSTTDEPTETPLDEDNTGSTPDPENPSDGGEVGDDGQPVAGQQRGPDGKFLPKTKKPDAPSETPEQKAAREQAEAAAKPGTKPAGKQKDHINDPIPEHLKQETKERMQGLITIAKEQTQRAEHAETQFTELYGAIQESTANPQQYGQALEYIKLVNSQDPAQLRKAISFMQKELGTLQGMLGEPVRGVDVLAKYPDLQQEVADGVISQQRAEELAALRNGQAHRTEVSTQQTAQQQWQGVVNQARADMNTLGVTLQADPAYAAKLPTVKALFASVVNDLHPSKWTAVFKQIWDKTPAPVAAPQPKPAITGVPANQPLRAKNPAGGATKAPASLFDAIDAGIAAAGG